MGVWDQPKFEDMGNAGKIITVVWTAFLVGVVVLLVGGIGYQIMFVPQPHDELIGSDTQIVSLKDSGTIESSFFLGCGSIKGEMQYTAYAVTDDGGYKLVKIPVDLTTIYEDEENAPKVTEYRMMVVSPEGEILRESNNNRWDYPYYEIHVPYGTIIQQYSLDAA